MFRYLRSAPKTFRSYFSPSQRRLSQKERFLRPLRLEPLEDRSLLAGLNTVIDDLLQAHFPPSDPNPSGTFTFTSTSDPTLVPAVIAVGSTVGGGTADIELADVSLTFSNMALVAGSWTGNVEVLSDTGTLFPGLLDIPVEDGDDADNFGVVGNIDLSLGNSTSRLALDDLDAEQLGWPKFLDISFSDLALTFADFRGNDNLNSLHLEGALTGFDTGNDNFNQLLSASNPLFGLDIQGSAETTLDIKAVEDHAAASILDKKTAMQLGLAKAAAEGLDGVSGTLTGKLFKVGDFDAGFIFQTVTVDLDGSSGSQPEQTASYLAVEGSFSIGDEKLGGRSSQWTVAFAISELGPLQFFVSGGQIKRFEPTTGLTIEEVGLGVRFNTTIEELQAETDFEATAATVTAAVSPDSGFIVTMTIPDHDFKVGDEFRVRNASNPEFNSLGALQVLSVSEDDITYKVDSKPAGQFNGSAEIVRLTIKDPFDLRDAGLKAGIGVPDDLAVWRAQLKQQVTNQILLGDKVWENLFENAVFGGRATISIDPIPDTMLLVTADLLIDTDLRILMNGTISLADGLIEGPASMYADLGKLFDGTGKFLYIADIPTIDAVLAEPLMVMRGKVLFESVKNSSDQIIGLKISEQGAIDLNIPEVTTLTLQGTETLTLTVPGTDIAQMEFTVKGSLSEPKIGTIGSVDGQFFVKIDGSKLISSQPLDGVELWGAALLTSNFEFLKKYGLFANASAVLRINSTGSDKSPIVLDVAGGDPLSVELPARTAAFRLDGNVEFFIDFDKNNKFDAGESMALFDGIFVFELTPAQGFNIAIFNEDAGAIVPATLQLGPTNLLGRRLFTAQTLGNLAIRGNGVAGHIYVGVSAKLPLDLADLNGQAVLIFNTTSQPVEFKVPGGASNPNRPSPGSTLVIPAAAPSSPKTILAAASSAADPAFNALKTGSPTWASPLTGGPYGVMFVKGNINLLGVLKNEVAGYVLLSKDLVSIDATFNAERNFLDLVSGTVKGSLFFSSEGEFQLVADGTAQLGPDWLNIHGGAHLVISYLDNNGTNPGGDGNRKLNVTGSLNVGLTIDIDPFPAVNLALAALDVSYKSGEITVSVSYPEPFWDESCVDTVIFGVVCIPYPNVRTSKYTFTVGTLTATPEPPPPPVLGQVDANGVLTLNVGPKASDRKLLVDEENEDVTIESPAAGSIIISLLGHSKRFDNVTSIKIADMGAGTDVVEIKSSVSTPVEVHFGAGNDRLKNAGSGVVKAYGDAGSDRLEGGSAGDSLYGGTGEDFIDGKGGQDLIEGDDDGDKLIGGDGADTIKGGKGGDLIVGDLVAITSVFTTTEPKTLISSEFATKASAIVDGDTIEGGDGADVVFGGSGSDNITGNASADRLFGGDGKATFFSATVTVVGSDLGLDGDDRMTWTVGDGNDVIDGQAGSDRLDIFGSDAADTGTLTATKITGLGTGTDGISYSRLETLNFSLGLGGDTLTVQETASGTANSIKTGSGSDNITVKATGQGGSITLDGQGDGDTYNIDLGSLTTPVTVADSGASGSDTLNVKGIAGSNDIVLEFAKLTRGTDVVNYSGVESLNIDTAGAADTFTILDNGAATIINSGVGNDQFTIGPAVDEDGEVIDANGNGTNTDELAIKGTSFKMTINGGEGNDDFEVNRNTADLFLNGENGNDVFVLNTLITGGDSTVDGGDDVDTITYLANAPVYINGGNGRDTIIVNGTKLDDYFIITGTTIEVVGSRLIDYTGIESFQANGRKGNDTFDLRGMLAAVDATLSGGAGNDTFNLGTLTPQTVDAIDGPVTISGDDGEDKLNIYDTGDTTANSGALTGTMLTGLGMQNGVTFGTLEALNISLGSGGNTFTIQDTYTGPTVLNSGSGSDTVNVRQIHGTTTVNAQAGHDTIKVGSLAPAAGGDLNQIAARLIVNGGDANPDTLNVDDTGDATPNSGVLTATELTGLGLGVGITYGTVETLNISLGAGGNNFNVQATAAGTATTLNTGDGNDVLTVDSNGALPNGTVDGVVSSLTINGQDGFSVLTMEDYSDTTGDTVHVTPTQVGAAAGDTFFGPGGTLTYSELDQVTLNMSQAYLPDTIYLTPSRLGTEFFIRGRDPQTPMQRAQLPGDALYLDFTGLTAAERLGVRLDATGVNDPADPVFNIWDIPGHRGVNYKQIEKMNHVQTLAVAADVGGNEPRVRVIDAETGLEKFNLLAFDAGFKGGVRVAAGDVNGDAIPDIITSAGPGGGPHVRVFNGATGERFSEPIGEFFAFPAGSKTTVYVAVGDINLDGLADIVTGSDSGGEPTVKVFDAYKLLTGQSNPTVSQFFAYDRRFTGGVRLAVGDLNGDGVHDIATGPGSGLNSQVRIFKTNLSADQATVTHSLLTSFSAFPRYNGGVNLAVGDVTGDGRADIVVGTGSGGTAMARIYNGAMIGTGKPPALLANFKPYGSQSGGVRVALVDLDGDGVNELITASALSGSKVKPKAFDLLDDGLGGLTPTAIDSYFTDHASDPFFEGALFLAGRN